MESESDRTRVRLHNLEGIAATFLDQQKAARDREEKQYRRLELRIQALTVVIAVAAVAVPIVLAVLSGT